MSCNALRTSQGSIDSPELDHPLPNSDSRLIFPRWAMVMQHASRKHRNSEISGYPILDVTRIPHTAVLAEGTCGVSQTGFDRQQPRQPGQSLRRRYMNMTPAYPPSDIEPSRAVNTLKALEQRYHAAKYPTSLFTTTVPVSE